MSDTYVEAYKKALTAILDKQDFDKLKQKFDAQLSAFMELWNAVMQPLEAALKKVPVPPQSDEKELTKVPDWLKDSIKRKCSKLYFLTPNPEIKLDPKGKKLVSLAVGFAYNWK